MGLTESKCVNLEGETALLEHSYTVTRTSGEKQDGFLLTKHRHRCVNTFGSEWKPRAHATLSEEGWRVHLHNGDQTDKEPDKHCCGWRRLGTFWPSSLDDDPETIRLWSDNLRDILERLAGEQGLPDHYEPHSCVRGAHPDYCDGCCAERRARREKKVILDQLKEIEEARKHLEEKLNDILDQKAHIHENEDLWDPKWGNLWDDLEDEECDISRQQAALDEKAYPLLKALKKIPTAAGHREWLAAKEAGPEALAAWSKAKIEEEQEEESPPFERSREQLEKELKMARSNYQSALMSDPSRPGWDRMCANLQDEVDDLEKELSDMSA